jgi:uncharacterized protein YrrD
VAEPFEDATPIPSEWNVHSIWIAVVRSDARDGGWMQRTSDLIGKAIMSADRGERLGTVSDVLIDSARGRAAALIVREGLLKRERVLPFDGVQVFGPDAVIVRPDAGALDSAVWKQRGVTARRASRLRHKRVITRAGREVGAVNDFYLGDSGTIEAYDVESSGFGGIFRRHARLPHTDDIALGDDVMIVSEGAADALEH